MLEILVFSLIIGLGYSLMASGFNLLLSVGRIINLAYGAHVVLVAYIYSTLAQSLQPGLAALIALAILTAIGTVGWSVLAALRRNEVLMIVVTLSIALVIEGMLIWIYGPYQRVVPVIVSGSIGWLNLQWLVTALIAVATYLGYFLLIAKTKIGKMMIATAEDPELAILYGMNPTRIYYITTAIASLFASLSGLLLSPFLTIYPHVAWLFLTIVLSVTIIGGVGSIVGSIVAGILISGVERVASYYIDPIFQGFVAPALVIGMLLLRPRGLFGKAELRWA
jgi:branched-chain amino acid transport system permease protein